MSANPVIVGVRVDYRDNHQLFEMIKGDHIHQSSGLIPKVRSERGGAYPLLWTEFEGYALSLLPARGAIR